MKLILVILLFRCPAMAQTPNCAPAPSGLVGWWKGDGNALDSAGTNNGVLVNGAGFAPGEVGQGFSLTGPDQGVLEPDAPELDPTNAVSVEAWVLLTSYPNTEGVLVVYKNVYFGPWDGSGLNLDPSTPGGISPSPSRTEVSIFSVAGVLCRKLCSSPGRYAGSRKPLHILNRWRYVPKPQKLSGYSPITEKKTVPSYWSSQFPDQSRRPNVTFTVTAVPFTPPGGTATCTSIWPRW